MTAVSHSSPPPPTMLGIEILKFSTLNYYHIYVQILSFGTHGISQATILKAQSLF